jgi:hypothetical protein
MKTKTTKKTFTTVGDVAQEIGLNEPGLILLKYLSEEHPDLALDYNFIMERVDDYNRVRKQCEDAGMIQDATHEAHKALMSGLAWSEYSLIFDAVATHYNEGYFGRHYFIRYEPAGEIPYSEVKKIALELRSYPILKRVFAIHIERFLKKTYQYRTDEYDEYTYPGILFDYEEDEFTSSCEYDDFLFCLRRVVSKLCEKRDELPF